MKNLGPLAASRGLTERFIVADCHGKRLHTCGKMDGDALNSPESIMPTLQRKRVVPSAERKLSGPGYPVEWEKMKARCRPLPHGVAIRECAYLSEEYRARHRWEAGIMVKLDEILATLRKKKIPFVLTGAYGSSGWTGRPRSTHDVDILVRFGRNHVRAVNALADLYPQLEVRRFPGLTAFFVLGETESVIDVAYPNREDNRACLETAIWTEKEGQRYRIPSLEAALANKYGAMLALGRDAGKRTVDCADFYFMVRHSMDQGRHAIDAKQLAELGELVWPGGGGAEILRLVEDAQAGNAPSLGNLTKKSTGPHESGQ